MTGPPPRVRVDKWLWRARFVKTRAGAARLVAGGRLRVNAERVARPSRAVGPGDTLTLAQARSVRLVRIRDVGTRRGPAAEARGLYEELNAAHGATDGPA